MAYWKWCFLLPALALFTAMAPGTRGGHRQKRSRANGDAQTEEAKVSSGNPLATALLVRWAEGQLSAVDVQELAQLAVMSGASDAEVQWLASIGAHGKNTSHCSRALYSKYCKDLDLPERYLVTVPLREKGNKEASLEIDISMLLPHDWFYCLGKAINNDEFLGITEIERWWQGSTRRNPKFFQHPCLDKDYKHKGLPYIMHGDGAKLHDRDSLLTVSIKPLLGKSGFKDSHWFLAALPKSVAAKEAWDKIWAAIAWSVDAIAPGVHPHADENQNPWPAGSPRASLAGKPLMPDGVFGVMWGMTGDLDFFMRDLGLPYHSSEAIC